MSTTSAANKLQAVAAQDVTRARQSGYVLPREARGAVTRAALAESLWKDVLALVRASLSYRRGRYYYTAPLSDRVLAEQSQQRDVQAAVERLLGQQLQLQQQGDTPGRVERR